MATFKQKMILTHLLRCCILFVILITVPDFIVALKDVSVSIPQAVKRGSNALLTCNYDMENETLYSVKWYKGRREFYRYTPKENPAMKVFGFITGLNVERNLSNQSHVVLTAVPLNISGKFTCEISVDAPSFQTAMMSGEMEVVELPEQQATVTGIQPRYRIGDLVDGNCSIKFSKPAANLTWTINGYVASPHQIKTYQIEKYEDTNLESVVSAIHFMVTTQHFNNAQMRLKCTASIFDIFKEEIENIIEEDRPRIMASGRSYDINNYPYEQHASGDGFEDHNESYLTYYSAADMSSSAMPTTRIFLHTYQKRLMHIWKTLYATIKGNAFKITSRISDGTTTSTTTTTLQHYIKSGLEKLARKMQTAIENLNDRWHYLTEKQQQSKRNFNAFNENDSSISAIDVVAAGITVVSRAASVAVSAVAMAIILTHHFMSCQNSSNNENEQLKEKENANEMENENENEKAEKNENEKLTKAKDNKKEIYNDNKNNNRNKCKENKEGIVTVTATTVVANQQQQFLTDALSELTAKRTCRKSFYNCTRKNTNEAHRISLLKWQKNYQQQQQQQQQQKNQQRHPQLGQQQQQQQQQEQLQQHNNKVENQNDDGNSKVARQQLSLTLATIAIGAAVAIAVATTTVAAASVACIIAAADVKYNFTKYMSKDQTLLMTAPRKCVHKRERGSQSENEFEFDGKCNCNCNRDGVGDDDDDGEDDSNGFGDSDGDGILGHIECDSSVRHFVAAKPFKMEFVKQTLHHC